MKKVLGYLLTVKNYFATDKGRHDTVDYIRAVLIIFFTIVLVYALLAVFEER